MSDDKSKALAQAREYCNCIRKADIDELHVLKSPPIAVIHCIEAVYILLNGRKPYDWRMCQNMLRRPTFLKDLMNFDVENAVSDIKMKELEEYINNPEFQVDQMTSKSLVAGHLCQWVHGVYNYQLIMKAN